MNTLVEGKTKRVVATDHPYEVRLEAIDRLTGGDAAKVAAIDNIGAQKTRQTANVFGLLNRAGVKTAFIEQVDDKALRCRKCQMLPLEFVTRRFAYGSYLKRRPDLKTDPAHRFDQVLFELFHKEALVMPPLVPQPLQMGEDAARARFLVDGQWAEGVYTDPYVDFTSDPNQWGLFSAKAPVTGAPLFGCPPALPRAELDAAVAEIVIPVFETLERAWASVQTIHGPVQLVDMKIELGRDAETGDLLLADVIDNDSWRVWPGGNPAQQLDKQAFRDGEAESAVAEKYALVTHLTDQWSQ